MERGGQRRVDGGVCGEVGGGEAEVLRGEDGGAEEAGFDEEVADGEVGGFGGEGFDNTCVGKSDDGRGLGVVRRAMGRMDKNTKGR